MVEFRTVASKIPNTLYTSLLHYCEREGIKPSAFIKGLIESEVSSLVPHNKSGRSVVSYNKKQETFSWHIEYDDDEKVEITRNITPDFIEDAVKGLTDAVKSRELYLQKLKKGSVPAPTKIKRVVK